MVWQFKRKWVYTQEEIAEQIGQIGDLMKMREKSTTQERGQFTEAIAVSQEVLAFMLDENVIKQGRKHERTV